MRKGSMQKLKYVIILEILRRETDSEHTMSTKVLLQKLSEYGIESSRETLYSDIKVLNENGFEILCNRGISNEYFVEDRNFDLPELKILMDAVQATSFITPKKTDELIDKIASLGGSHRAELLKNDTVIYNTIKHTNEHIYYSINEIAQAISNNKKIVFKYFDYSETKERVYRKDGKNFCLNPIALMINNDNYYLVGYNDYFKKILHYRVDRMTEVRMVSHDKVEYIGEIDFDLKKHHKQLFGMYSGEERKVTIQFDRELIDVVIDKFGEDAELTPRQDGTVWVESEVQVSPQFIAWVNSFENKMKVISPKRVVEQVKSALLSAIEQYN